MSGITEEKRRIAFGIEEACKDLLEKVRIFMMQRRSKRIAVPLPKQRRNVQKAAHYSSFLYIEIDERRDKREELFAKRIMRTWLQAEEWTRGMQQ